MPLEWPRIDDKVAAGVLALLRGRVPDQDAPPDLADAALRRLECGGYLRALWRRAGRSDSLPRGWADALERGYRKTVVDTLAALADFRVLGRVLADERVPFVLLKGSSYLFDLYDDPGERTLTDIDLLIRPEDAVRLHRRLLGAGYRTTQWDDEYRKFEVIAPGPQRCSFEVHWRLGMAEYAIDQGPVLERARPALLEDLPCRRLAPEDAVLYHVAHMADHFFGPSLKWLVDLDLMRRRWPLDDAILVERAGRWGTRTALALALRHRRRIFPEAAPDRLEESLGLGPLRRLLLRPYRSRDALFLMRVGNGLLSRYAARCLLLDRPSGVLRGVARALKRPLIRRLAAEPRNGAPPQLWR